MDASDEVFITGDFGGTLDANALGGGCAQQPVAPGGNDLFVARLDGATGACKWSERFGGAGGQIGRDLVTHGTSIVVAGDFSGSLDFGDGNPMTGPMPGMGTDIVLVELDGADGHAVWSRQFTGAGVGHRLCERVAVDGIGDLAVTGSFDGQLDFSNGVSPLDDPLNDGNYTSKNFFVAKLDASGGHLWSLAVGEPMNQTALQQIGHGVAMDGSGAVYVAAEWSGVVDFSLLPAPWKQGRDAILLKLSP